MIRQTSLQYWTRVTRMVRGQIVRTTCCCPAAGATRRDCMAANGRKTPCRCACHGHEISRGVRFRQLDGEVPPVLPECEPEKLAEINATITAAVLDSAPDSQLGVRPERKRKQT